MHVEQRASETLHEADAKCDVELAVAFIEQLLELNEDGPELVLVAPAQTRAHVPAERASELVDAAIERLELQTVREQ